MSTNISPIHLLLSFHSDNEAEAIVSLLRNSGFAVRPTILHNEFELTQALEKQPADLLLVREHCEELSFEQVMSVLQLNNSKAPVVLLVDKFDSDTFFNGLSQGATNVAPFDHQALIVHLFRKEIHHSRCEQAARLAEQELQEAEQRCNLLLDSSKDPIAYIADGMHIYANSAYTELFGFEDADDLAGLPVLDLIGASHQAEFKKFLHDFPLQGKDDDEFPFTAVKEGGEEFEATLSLSKAVFDDEDCLQMVIHQGQYNPELEKQIEALSVKDFLTGLFHKHYFFEQLDKTLQAQVTSSLLYIELDNFDDIRHTIGIANSDTFLANVADWIKEKSPESAILSRLGEDIFAILMPELDLEQGKSFADSLCAELHAASFEVNQRALNTSCSIGIVQIDNASPQSYQDVIASANSNCMRARNKGGNSVSHSTMSMSKPETIVDQKIIEQLQDAWDQDRLHTYFQPIVNLHGELGHYYEVLLRIKDEHGDEISAEKFYPVAKQVGLSAQLDRWVIQHVCQKLKVEYDKGRNIHLFTMLSVDSLLDDSLIDYINEHLQINSLPANSVILQITDEDATTYLPAASKLANNIHALQGALCLSHFGLTSNSFRTLAEMNPSFVKIEPSLAKNLTKNNEAQENLHQIVDKVHSDGKMTIVPQIEDAATVATLWQYDVNYIQGYYLAEPGPTLDYEFQDEG